MVKIGKIVSLLVVTFCISGMAQDKVTVSAIVSDNQLSVGQTFDYQIKVQTENSASISEPRLPSIEGFDFVGRSQSQEINTSFVNGEFKTVRSQSFNYRFQANRNGKFVLGAADVTVNGQSYRTNKINITVSGEAQPQTQPNVRPRAQIDPMDDPFEAADEIFSQLLQRRGYQSPPPDNTNLAFFVRVEVDKTDVYVGEQVTASWYLYTRYNITDIDTLKYPTLNKFWKEDIEIATRLNFKQEIINGIPYRKALLAKYALFPIKPGKAKVDAYKAKCTVVMGSALGGLGFGRPRTYTRSSQEISIDVKPLPTEGRPETFAGAVGQFEMRKIVDSDTVKVNEPFSFKLRFEGRGNAKRIDLPPMDLADTIESYDTKTESKYFKDGRSFKEFEMLFIPREPGKLVIPEIAMSYFDPDQEKYLEQSVPATELNVLPGTRMSEKEDTFSGSEAAQTAKAKALPLTPISGYSTPSFAERNSVLIWTSIYTTGFALIGIKALIAFGFVTVRRNFGHEVGQRARLVQHEVKNQNWKSVGTGTHNLINFVLSEIIDDDTSASSVPEKLAKVPPSLREEMEESVSKIFPQVEALGFAPDQIRDSIDKEKFTRDFKELLERLEKVAAKAHSYRES